MTIRGKLGGVSVITILAIVIIASLAYYINRTLINTLDLYRANTDTLAHLFRLNKAFLETSEGYQSAVVMTMMGARKDEIDTLTGAATAGLDQVVGQVRTSGRLAPILAKIEPFRA